MPPELKKILLTVPFVIILIVMFFWLVRALLPGGRRGGAEAKFDNFDRAGYESITDIQRKETGIMVVGVLVIVICILLAGALGYYAFTSASSGDSGAGQSFELIFTFIPAVVLLSLVIAASRRYMKAQHQTMREFRQFQASRQKALAEYEEKRRGRRKAHEEKTAPKPKTKRPERPDRSKKRRPKLR